MTVNRHAAGAVDSDASNSDRDASAPADRHAGAEQNDRERVAEEDLEQGQDRRENAGDAREVDPGSSSLNPLQVVSSVLAAGLGVQSSRNRERDFRQGRAVTFIVAGLVFTALFIGGVYTVVSLVLAGR